MPSPKRQMLTIGLTSLISTAAAVADKHSITRVLSSQFREETGNDLSVRGPTDQDRASGLEQSNVAHRANKKAPHHRT